MSRSMDQTRIKKWVDRIVEEINVNAARVSQEIRETGELAVLLGKAARGQSLSREERRKVREQLVDLAKIVPSLAILAAPGGTLILAALLKVLPFNLLPSAFQSRPGASNGEPEGAAAAASAGEVSGAPDAGESVAAQPLSRAGSAEEMAVAAPESGEGLEADEAPAETMVSELRGAAGEGEEPAAAEAPGGDTRKAGGA